MQAQPPSELPAAYFTPFPSIALCATNGSTDLSNGTITDWENITGGTYANTALNERWPRPEDEPRQAGPVGAAATAEPSPPGGNEPQQGAPVAAAATARRSLPWENEPRQAGPVAAAATI